ncbi:MAG: divalent-cation tolerance protein CutA [Candidatus Omnitrophota bacterium]|jgi:periplasmic divalent cation tolerance protein
MRNKYIQVVTTISSKRGAGKIANALIKGRLAACVQIAGPIKSIYRWKGRVETAKEWICIAKAKRTLYKRIEKVIRENHPYDTPEIIAVPITAGSKDYLKWIQNSSLLK